MKTIERVRGKRGEIRFTRGTAMAMREADRLTEGLRTGALTREELLISGRAFATVEDWVRAVA